MMIPMTPLTTLRTAQLFQISWPRISSTVGKLIGSIGGFSTSFVFEEPFETGFSESSAIVEAETEDKQGCLKSPQKLCNDKWMNIIIILLLNLEAKNNSNQNVYHITGANRSGIVFSRALHQERERKIGQGKIMKT